MSINESLRACMIRTVSRGLWAARKLMDIEREEISLRSGFTPEELADIEEGREQLTAKGYIALAAFFDNLFSSGKYSGIEPSVRKLLDADYSGREIPSWYADNIRNVFRGMNFLQKWFASFEDSVNQFHKASDEKISDSELEFICENYNIFIDDSAAKHEKFPEILQRFRSCMKTGNIFITEKSLSEIERTDSNFIQIISQDEIISVFEADGTIREIFEESTKNRFFFLTNNEGLAFEILNSPVQEIRKAPVLSAYICEDGNIALYDKEDVPPEKESDSQEEDGDTFIQESEDEEDSIIYEEAGIDEPEYPEYEEESEKEEDIQ